MEIIVEIGLGDHHRVLVSFYTVFEGAVIQNVIGDSDRVKRLAAIQIHDVVQTEAPITVRCVYVKVAKQPPSIHLHPLNSAVPVLI
jgi:hypothetical protein